MPLTDFTNPADPADDDPGNPGAGGAAGSGANAQAVASILAQAGGGPFAPPPGFNPDGSDELDILIDYNEKFARTTGQTLFRDGLIRQVMAVLTRRWKPNPLLVGPAGVGKTRVVEALAAMIADGDPRVPAALAFKTIFELPLAALVAGCSLVGQLEAKVLRAIEFAADPDNAAIIFIDEIHQLSGDTSPMYSKIAQILKPALARGDIAVIGATTVGELKALTADPAFTRRFSTLQVDELTPGQTVAILREAAPRLVAHHGGLTSVDDALVEQVVAVSDAMRRADQHRPDSALTLLDQTLADTIVNYYTACAAANLTADVAALRAGPLPITVGRLREVAHRLVSGNSRGIATASRATLAAQLKDRLVGQDDAIDQISQAVALMSVNLGVSDDRKPATWMLMGPSGVGKTEATKVLSRHLTGENPIVLNMSEYAHEHDVSKLVGSGPGYIGSNSAAELPFDVLDANPTRVVLLDEFDKAHPQIHKLFLSVLDEGHLRTAMGKVVDFSHAIVIATTNAGSRLATTVLRPVGFTAGNSPRAVSRGSMIAALENEFPSELIGRFEHLVAFAALTREHLAQIIAAHYTELVDGAVKASPRLADAIDRALPQAELDALVDETFNPALGARPGRIAARRRAQQAAVAALAALP
ncbi:MAG: AAA family ATPase [Bifidobacteriaceae bacterium]|jgi:ATP-dependent Clp protease ATP-binding subunit ClpA|nr:AAA family ATPase [Bifidobacteriaceae bacterium]